MTKSDQIRQLALNGLSVSAIAQQVGVTYQHAYNVLRQSGKLPEKANRPVANQRPPKPNLRVETLLAAGFTRICQWHLGDAGVLALTGTLPNDSGVYAFAQNDVVVYVGVATGGLKGRLYGYSRPGRDQKTNIRLNAVIKQQLDAAQAVEVLIASPADMEWNALPVHGAAGLELGLIKTYALPWNMRSAG